MHLSFRFFGGSYPYLRGRISAALALLGLLGFLGFLGTVHAGMSAAESKRFELRGILDLGGVNKSFSLKDTENGSVFWIELGRTLKGVHAQSYDSSGKVLSLEVAGVTHRLQLAAASDEPLVVLTDRVVAEKKIAEEKRIQAPTLNPRLRPLIMERRRQGMIRPVNKEPDSASLRIAAGARPTFIPGVGGSRSDTSASIQPAAEGEDPATQPVASEPSADSVSEGDDGMTDPSPSPAQASEPAPAPYPAPPEGMRYNGGPEDPNPRIVSKNEIRYPTRK